MLLPFKIFSLVVPSCIFLGYSKSLLREDSDKLSHHCGGIRFKLTVLEKIDVTLGLGKFRSHELLGGRHAASGTSNGIFLVNLQGFMFVGLVDLSDLSILSPLRWEEQISAHGSEKTTCAGACCVLIRSVSCRLS